MERIAGATAWWAFVSVAYTVSLALLSLSPCGSSPPTSSSYRLGRHHHSSGSRSA
jgi:hypothetical protein